MLYSISKTFLTSIGCSIAVINRVSFPSYRYILAVQWVGPDWPNRLGAIFTGNQRQDPGGSGGAVCPTLVRNGAQNRLQCGKHSICPYTWAE